MSAERIYPPSVVGENERAEYDDAFLDGEADNADGVIRNDYAKGTSGWLGYEAGVAAFQSIRADWEAQAAYSARWYS